MIIIKCSRCNKKIFKYIKIGKGRLLRCYKDRIFEDFSVNDKTDVKCECGNLIGIDVLDYIKLKKNSVILKGLKT
jgi:hypothetical protein